MRKIAVITGSRSEYGILRNLMKLIKENSELDLNLVVTGMHLSPEFGNTSQEILNDGFSPVIKIESLLSTDSKVGVSKSIALGILGLTEELDRIKPEFTIILGDRFEMMAAAIAAIHSGSNLVHISGGDVASGVFDNFYRHSITKMAQIHFVSTPLSLQRVLLMGENPDFVYLTGSLAYDEILHANLPSRNEIAKTLGLNSTNPMSLAIYHPSTNEEVTLREFKSMISALEIASQEFALQVILLYPNADPGGRELIEQLHNLDHDGWILRENLPRELYIALLKESVFIVGNSSSGIVEAAAAKTPSINIGHRQDGRERAGNTIDVNGDREKILTTIRRIIADPEYVQTLKNSFSPYGDGRASVRILNTLINLHEIATIHTSKFYDATELVLKLKRITKVPYQKFQSKAITSHDLLAMAKRKEEKFNK